MTNSYGALMGKWLVPIFAPIGLGYWQISLALIAGISAKEVVVSSFVVLFDGLNINSGAALMSLAGTLGSVGFTPLNAYCMTVPVSTIAILSITHKFVIPSCCATPGSYASRWI